MTYFEFHLRYNGPVLISLGTLSLLASWNSGVFAVFLLILLMVIVFTTPWDNYAVYRGIWNFSPVQIFRRIGYIPLEEYLFFVVQTLEVLLLTHALTRIWPIRLARNPPLFSWPILLSALVVLGLWVGLGQALTRRLPRRYHYLFHLLYWFGIVLAGQWIIAAPLLAANLILVLVPTLAIGFYLCWADYQAIGETIWFFDSAQITGLLWHDRLPLEEILFFFVTSLLVAQSYVMLIPAIAV